MNYESIHIKWPEPNTYEEAFEPVVLGTVVCPSERFKEVNQLCLSRRGVFESRSDISGDRLMVKYRVSITFYANVKSSVSS